MQDNLLKKFLSFSYGSWIGLVIGLLGTIISTRILQPEDFGKASMFTLALNISMIIINLGADQSFVRFFYEEKESNRGGLLYNCISIPLVISFVFGLIILIFSENISMLLFNEKNFVAVLLLAIGVMFQLLYGYGVLVIRMQQKGNLYSAVEIMNRTLGVATLVALYIFMGANYLIIILTTVINLIILSMYTILKERKIWNLKNFNKKDLVHTQRDILKFGTPIVLATLISWLFQSFDKIAIKQWSSFNELGLYAAAFKIVALVIVVQSSFTTFWTPVAFERFQKNPDDKKFFSDAAKIVSLVMIFVSILTIMGKDIIVLLLGEDYKQAANIMPFLVFMPLIYTISETTVIGINFFKRTKWHIFIAGAACAVNLVGNWILVPSYGAIGASISTAISYIVFFTFRTIISLKFYKVEYGLKKIYFMLILLSIYASYSVYTTSFMMNFFVGIIMIIVLATTYRTEVLGVRKIIKQLIK